MRAEEFVDRLERVRRSGKGWIARCPGHDDDSPSLSVTEGDDGRVLLNCHAGCTTEDVVTAMGLTLSDLFPENGNGRRQVDPMTLLANRGLRPETIRHFEVEAVVEKHAWRFPVGRRGFYRFKNFSSTAEPKYWWSPAKPKGDGDVYGLRPIADREEAYLVEGEPDVWTMYQAGLPAFSFTGGAGTIPRAGVVRVAQSHIKTVRIIPDKDDPGREHARKAAEALRSAGLEVEVLELPVDLPEGADVTSLYVKLDCSDTVFREKVRTLPRASRQVEAVRADGNSPWAAAMPAPDFLAETDALITYLEDRILIRGSLTELFSPRGIGKTHIVHAIAVRLARQGLHVLLLDRDNSRREVRRRLRHWGGADAATLKVLTREQTPPLTDRAAWDSFPTDHYDVVILDSLESSTEGVGEQDSAKPSLALAPVLDIVRRANGPAMLVLGNTVRSGAHSRGSGVVEDRADIVYEVRDATGLRPSGRKPWYEELPPASADAWAERATRRKKQTIYRLALVPSKFRVGEEPDPFALQIDLTSNPWTMRDVTLELDRAGEEARVRAEAEQREKLEQAAAVLAEEIQGETLNKGQAESFLMDLDLTREESREVLSLGEGARWQFVELRDVRGRPKVLRPVAGSKNPAAEIPPRENLDGTRVLSGDFRGASPGAGSRKYPLKTLTAQGFSDPPISAAENSDTPDVDPERGNGHRPATLEEAVEILDLEPVDDRDDRVRALGRAWSENGARP